MKVSIGSADWVVSSEIPGVIDPMLKIIELNVINQVFIWTRNDDMNVENMEYRIGRYEGVIRDRRADYLGNRSRFRDPEAATPYS